MDGDAYLDSLRDGREVYIFGTEFGGRHELYERHYAGNHEQIRVDVVNFAKRSGVLDECHRLVEQCLNDYDLDGWRD